MYWNQSNFNLIFPSLSCHCVTWFLSPSWHILEAFGEYREKNIILCYKAFALLMWRCLLIFLKKEIKLSIFTEYMTLYIYKKCAKRNIKESC